MGDEETVLKKDTQTAYIVNIWWFSHQSISNNADLFIGNKFK